MTPIDEPKISRAIAAARSAFATWSIAPLEDRIEYLRALEQHYRAEKEKIAATISSASITPSTISTLIPFPSTNLQPLLTLAVAITVALALPSRLLLRLLLLLLLFLSRHSERSDESLYFVFALHLFLPLPLPLFLPLPLLFAFAVAFLVCHPVGICFCLCLSFASRYPKASALGLSPTGKQLRL